MKTHVSYSLTMDRIRSVERLLRDLKSRVQCSVQFPAVGGGAVEDSRAVELLDELHDFLLVETRSLMLELTSPCGAFTAEAFRKHLQRPPAATRGRR
jgi:hypothetical protein